jgi:hypothetical protein
MDIALKNKNKTCKLLQTELSWADPAFWLQGLSLWLIFLASQAARYLDETPITTPCAMSAHWEHPHPSPPDSSPLSGCLRHISGWTALWMPPRRFLAHLTVGQMLPGPPAIHPQPVCNWAEQQAQQCHLWTGCFPG